jgi:hypothetical protein
VPELPEGQKRRGAPQKPRREQIEDDGREPLMPPLDWGDYLVEYLFEIGPTLPTGMGSAPLTPPVIESAQRLLGIEFQPWEARLLLRLSREYLAESLKATKDGCPPPWVDSENAEADRIATAKRLEQAMMDLLED